MYQSTPSDGMSSAMAPGAWAPSTRTGTPRARQRGGDRRDRQTSALSAAMWSTMASRVRGPRAASTPRHDLIRPIAPGTGIATARTMAPRSRAANVAALVTPP